MVLLKVDSEAFLFGFVKLILGLSCVYALAGWGFVSLMERRPVGVKLLIRALVACLIGGMLTPIVMQAMLDYDDPKTINTVTLSMMGVFTILGIITGYPQKTGGGKNNASQN